MLEIIWVGLCWGEGRGFKSPYLRNVRKIVIVGFELRFRVSSSSKHFFQSMGGSSTGINGISTRFKRGAYEVLFVYEKKYTNLTTLEEERCCGLGLVYLYFFNDWVSGLGSGWVSGFAKRCLWLG